MAKIVFLFINVYEGIRKEKIDSTFKIARFEEFFVVAEVVSFVSNPVLFYEFEKSVYSLDFYEKVVFS